MQRAAAAGAEAEVHRGLRPQIGAEPVGERDGLRVLAGKGAVIQDKVDLRAARSRLLRWPLVAASSSQVVGLLVAADAHPV